jgi:beta-glucuronidase
MVIDETPAVGQNMGLAAVALGVKHTTFSPETIDERSQAAHAQAIRELVARDENHPSVVLWSIANEPESDTDAAVEYFEPLFALIRELDPTRPVGSANMMFAPHGRDRLQAFGDVLLLNRYYGWYAFTGDLARAEVALEKELSAWAAEGKPIVVTEYGADAMPGFRSVTPQPWSEEYQADFLAMYHRVFDRIDAVVGEHVWAFADFATSAGISRVDGNRKGVFTRDRRPKAAAFVLRRRCRGEH